MNESSTVERKVKMDNLILLVMAESRMAVKPEDSLEDRCRASMKAAKGHWMVLDEDMQFKGAIAAVLETANDEETHRITSELEVLKALSAAMSGVPVDFGSVAPAENAVGLSKIWREV
jgi:hypothetical protein